MNFPVYLDNHATTKVDTRVLEVMLPCFSENFGNAASRQHKFGWRAEEVVEHSRKSIAKFFNAESSEIIFTAGATESNNLAIQGIVESYKQKGNHIITCATEHHSVLDVCKHLEKRGTEITYLRVDKYGMLDLEELKNSIKETTILISLMAANNEIGTIHPLKTIGAISREHNILFHTDATQLVGKILMDVQKLKIDLLSFSGHKIYGPKGIGALYVRKKNPRVNLTPINFGGGQEKGLRSGTLNVPGIAGMGKAVEICMNEIETETQKMFSFRNLLQKKLFEEIPDIWLNGHPTERISNNVNIGFDSVDAQALMMGMKEIAVSSGSACSTSQALPSHVLKAIGLSSEKAHSCIRFGIGRFNTEEEIEYTAKRVREVVEQLRSVLPKYKVRGSKERHTELHEMNSGQVISASLQ